MLWFVYGLRDYPASDFWWTASDPARREVVLLDAAEKIERYGVPWVESPAAPKPWEMPVQRADEFGEAVQAVMAPEMERLGYHLEQQLLPGNLPYSYFSKAMPDGTFALIELQSIYSLDPGEFNFDVRLQRRVDGDPLEFNGDYGQWRSISLAQLVWQTRSSVPLRRCRWPRWRTCSGIIAIGRSWTRSCSMRWNRSSRSAAPGSSRRQSQR